MTMNKYELLNTRNQVSSLRFRWTHFKYESLLEALNLIEKALDEVKAMEEETAVIEDTAHGLDTEEKRKEYLNAEINRRGHTHDVLNEHCDCAGCFLAAEILKLAPTSPPRPRARTGTCLWECDKRPCRCYPSEDKE